MGLLTKAGVKAADGAEPESQGAAPARYEKELRQYIKTHPEFLCLVTAPSDPKDVASLISLIGASCPLPGGQNLVLLPAETDSQLLARQLSLSLHAEVLAVINAESYEDAMKGISPFLS
jgi:hypothetical protein